MWYDDDGMVAAAGLFDVPPVSAGDDINGWVDGIAPILAARIERRLRAITANVDLSSPHTAITGRATVGREWDQFVHDDIAPTIRDVYLLAAAPLIARAGVNRVAVRRAVERAADAYVAVVAARLVRAGREVEGVVAEQALTVNPDLPSPVGVEVVDAHGWTVRVADLVAVKAAVIAWQEAQSAATRAQFGAAQALQGDGPVEKVWWSVGDSRVRPSHRAAHAQTVPVTERFAVGSSGMDGPHDPDAPAVEVMGCRCHVEFLFPGDTRPDGTVVGADLALTASTQPLTTVAGYVETYWHQSDEATVSGFLNRHP